MTNEPKTPGQVAHAAHERAIIDGGSAGSPVLWEQIHPQKRREWEAAAKAVREQHLGELRGLLRATPDDPDIAKLERLRIDLSWWWIQDWTGDTDMALSHLLDAVGPFMPDESDEPKRE